MYTVVRQDWTPIKYKSFKFSGGEVQVKLEEPQLCKSASSVTIHGGIYDASEIMELMLVADAIRRANPTTSLRYVCWYLPYARQDRVCYPGESLALRVMANVLNSIGFSEVFLLDPHSDVAAAVINNSRITTQEEIVASLVAQHNLGNVVLVAPDAGAAKKTMGASKLTGLPFVQADKKRNPENGEITGTVVHAEHIGDRDFLIVDDICDGGRTFIELAKVLRPLTSGRILLYVTHGIFSKGLQVFDGLIDHIYACHVFPGVIREHPILTVLD